MSRKPDGPDTSNDHEDERSERLRSGYERMLAYLHESFPNTELRLLTLREHLERARDRLVSLGEHTRDEAEEIQEYLRRDLEDAGDWLSEHTNSSNVRDWLRMDLQLIENWLWDAFSSVADRTRMQLESFSQTGEPALYRTGEVAGPGELACLSCQRTMAFTRVARIPPCPSCTGTEFIRAARASEND